MAENKTQPTDASVDAFIDALPDARKQADARWLLAQMSALSGEPAVMWGPTLVGFGRYHYRYESGREGDFFRVGFSPRKASLVVYIMPGFDAYDGLLARLGRHKTGSSCLYITRLDAIDREVLTSLIAASLAAMDARYPREA
ncbi:MAG: DUF1801 domain-containing protein [Myxococcales bacterium]|nr:DUF1801 domain-containing protein [Myxococcales bacterium]MCB9546289.1 DUF1801 domain-containing protein [Myxococcales bacterium]